MDGYVVACFGDPGLDAAREVASGPVVGIAEAGCTLATMLGRDFSVVTTLGPHAGPGPSDLVAALRLRRHCRSIYACEVPVLELTTRPPTPARSSSTTAAARSSDDEADSVVLGCAGMTDFCRTSPSRSGCR